MKVIFLDIDGVLNPGGPDETRMDHYTIPLKFKPEAVKNLNLLLEKSQAKLVISSRWARRFEFTVIATILATHGITGPYVIPQDVEPNKKDHISMDSWLTKESAKFWGVSTTPKKFSSDKCHEISFWLSDYADKISGYVVIDDDRIYGQEEYSVKVNADECLTEKDVEKSLKILNSGMDKYHQKRAAIRKSNS